MIKFKEELESKNRICFLNPFNFSEDQIKELPLEYSTRVVVLTEENEVVLIKVNKGDYHTLVGGEIEEGETILEGMFRECMEESGYNVSVVTQLGYIEFCKKKYKRFAFGFLVKAIGEQKELSLTDEEIEQGHEVFKYSIDKALEILENDYKKDENSASFRSLLFLQEAQKYLNSVVK